MAARKTPKRTFLHYVFDQKRADEVIKFIERCCFLHKGVGGGKPIKLRPWQKEIIGELFGWIDPKTGFRRYRTLYLALPRKNGKSHLIACIACVAMFFDDEPGAEVVLAANSKEQSTIVFNAAHEMIRQSPILSKRAKRLASTYRIKVEETSSVLKSIAADGDTALGLDPSCYIFDEYAFCSDPDFAFALSTSQGSRTQPLACFITTAGYDLQGVGYKKWLYARSVLKDPASDPTFLPVLYELPMSEDWTLETNWARVNPALGDFRSLQELKDSFVQAVTPEEQHKFRQFYLNQWLQAPKHWLSREHWDACADPHWNLGALKNIPCFLAFDLSAVQDITAIAAVFTLPDGRYYIKTFNFLPDYNGALKDKEIKDHVPYQAWSDNEHITLTPGMAIDQDYVLRKIEELADNFMVKCVGFDPHGATKIVSDLEKLGLLMVKVRPGPITLSEPMKELERLVLQKKIVHDGNPCFGWQVSNVVPRRDALGNMAPDKDRASGRIDAVVASIMAIHCALRLEVEPEKPKADFRITVLG